MKAIMISIKPKWCAEIMNGNKTIEIRKNKALATAIQKLIDENGFADIYVYCSKINRKHYHLLEVADTDTDKTEYEIDYYIGGSDDYLDYCYEGKVAFKFRCYKVEEIMIAKTIGVPIRFTKNLPEKDLCIVACLTPYDFDDYLRDELGYAIHISELEIFDKPKELSDFIAVRTFQPKTKPIVFIRKLKKAPQNYCYVEVK